MIVYIKMKACIPTVKTEDQNVGYTYIIIREMEVILWEEWE